jgi:probable lipoprotein (TIGR04455 family)
MRLWVPLLFLASGCSIVKSSRVVEGWPTQGATSVKRLVVLTQPLPQGDAKVGTLFARVARRYVNMKRDFLVKSEVTQEGAAELSALCTDGLEGVLHLSPKVVPQGDGFEVELTAKLLRCSDGAVQWESSAAGSFEATDSRLLEVTQVYVRELGPEVERQVPLALNLLRPVLDTLPQPKLTDADVEEKVTLDE